MTNRYVQDSRRFAERSGGAPYPPVDGTEPCRADPAAFFPEVGDPGARARAKALCNGDPAKGVPPCHVFEQCLAYAVSHDIHGVWGGSDESQRGKMRRAQGITAVRIPGVVDSTLVIRAYRRGMQPPDIARLADTTLDSVQQVLTEVRRRERIRERERKQDRTRRKQAEAS